MNRISMLIQTKQYVAISSLNMNLVDHTNGNASYRVTADYGIYESRDDFINGIAATRTDTTETEFMFYNELDPITDTEFFNADPRISDFLALVLEEITQEIIDSDV